MVALPETSRTLPSRYETLDVLGESSRSLVLRVRDVSSARDVALKILKGSLRKEESLRFRREFGILASLDHPNIVCVHEFGFLASGEPYFTMELVRGRRITDVFDGRDWAGLADLILQTVSGLHHIHGAGITHLDLKPSNLLIDEGGRIRIMDFGLAVQHEQLSERRIRGTLHYMAPEVLSQDRVDSRADQYGLGMTLYETITGALPTYGLPAHEVITFQLEGQLRAPSQVHPEIPAPMERLVLRLLERDPRHRFPSTAALLHEVARITGLDQPREALVTRRPDLLVPPLIGRQEVTRTIEEAIEQARRGRGGGLLVLGEEGVGKSRLIRETVLRAQLTGARLFQGRCPVNGKSIYAPFHDIFQQIVRTVNPGADPAREVMRLVRSASGAGERSLNGQKFRLFNRVSQSIQDFYGFLNVVGSSGSPMLLVVEDLQWADRATMELFSFLVGEARSSYLLLVGVVTESRTAQSADDPTPAEQWIDRARESGMRCVRVPPLGESEVRELVQALLGAEVLPQELVRWMTWESAGNPSRVRRLVDALIARNLLEWREGEWQADMLEVQQLRFPGGAAAAWAERVARLPLRERTMLQIASIFGEHFEIDDVSAIAGVPSEDVFAAIEEMTRDELVESADEDGRFRFPQCSVRDAVYASLSQNARRDLHLRAAMLLEQQWRSGRLDVIGQLSYHCARGEDYARGIEHSLAAGEQAAAALVFDQAAEFYSTALELMDLEGLETEKAAVRERLGDAYFRANHLRQAMHVYQFLLKSLDSRSEPDTETSRAHLLKKIGRVHAKREDHESALTAFELAASIFRSEGDRLGWAEMLSRQAWALGQTGQREQAEEAARVATDLLSTEGESSVHGYLEHTLGSLAGARGDRQEALARFNEALRIAERCESTQLVRLATAAAGDILWKLGRWDEALTCFRANLEASEQDGDLWDLVHAYVDVARIESSRGNWHEAAELLEKTIRIDTKLGLPEHEAIAQIQLGMALERTGRWKEAKTHLDRSIEIEGFDETRPERVAAYLPLARITARTGDPAAGHDLALRAYEAARRAHDEELGAEAALTLSEIESTRDNMSEAVHYAAEATRFFESSSLRQGLARALSTAADLALRQQSIEQARELTDRALEEARQLDDAWTAASAQAIKARLLYLDGEREEAEQLFREVLARFDQLHAPWEAARTLLELGLLREDQEEAARELTSARQIFERLEAVHEIDRVRGALARVRPGSRRQEPVIGLYEIVKIINSTLDVDEVLHRVLDLALRRLRADRGLIVLIDPVTGELKTRIARNLRDDESSPRSPQTVVREVIRTGKPMISADAQDDQRLAASESVVADHVMSMLCVPLVIRDRIAGSIYVDHREASHLFTQRDLNFLEAFSDQAAIAIENARLYQEIDGARARLTVENESLRREVLVEKHLDSIIGGGEAVARIQFAIRKAASSSSTVLIRGESGTGKGLVARIIHNVSQRRNGPFIHFNCAALPETLAESELFGHERGAFTGADRRKAGRFELANGGTIFLDEIGKIGLAMQSKLLRVVEEKEFERVGGTQTISTDVKVLAATNLDLERAIADGTFREDLYYRLNIIPIHLPPLRERKGDIPLLVEHFMRKICRDLGVDLRRLEPGLLDLFFAYDWPGNVRELEAVIHRAIVMSNSDLLQADDFYALLTRSSSGTQPRTSSVASEEPIAITAEYYEEAISRLDRQLIERALAESEGRIREAARKLGLARNTLKARMQKYGVKGRD